MVGPPLSFFDSRGIGSRITFIAVPIPPLAKVILFVDLRRMSIFAFAILALLG